MQQLPKVRVQTKIIADRDPEDAEKAANEFLAKVTPEMVGTITHETKVDELQRLIYIIKINYHATVLA